MGGSKRSSHTAEYRHEKWVKKMQSQFQSAEARGYTCSNCQAACAPNNWLYHAFDPHRGVLCFYSIVKHTSHSDSLRIGLNGYRGPSVEHTMNLGQKVKVLSGVGVKVGYDVGISKEKEKADDPLSIELSKLALKPELKLDLGLLRASWYAGKDMADGSEDDNGDDSQFCLRTDKVRMSHLNAKSTASGTDEVDGPSNRKHEISTTTTMNELPLEQSDAKSLVDGNENNNNSEILDCSPDGVLDDTEFQLDVSTVDETEIPQDNISITSDAMGKQNKETINVSYNSIHESLNKTDFPLDVSTVDDNSTQDCLNTTSENTEDQTVLDDICPSDNDSIRNQNDKDSDNRISDSSDEPDFFGKKTYCLPSDDEEKLYFCVSCIMGKGTPKVQNEVRNICREWGIEVDEK